MTYAEPPDLAPEMLPLQDAPSEAPLASWKLTFFQKCLTNTFQIRAIQPPLPRVTEHYYQHDLSGEFSTLERTVVTFADGILSMHGRNGAFC